MTKEEKIIEKNTVDIHGRSYLTVPGRVQLIHDEQGAETFTIETEVLSHQPVVIKATVTCKRGTFTGISAANPMKNIEKQSPYEVAETSAVGRALGFANYGLVDSIASADEVTKAIREPMGGETIAEELDRKTKPYTADDFGQEINETPEQREMRESMDEPTTATHPETAEDICPIHGLKMFLKTGPYGEFYSHGEKQDDGSWKNCNGKSGYK